MFRAKPLIQQYSRRAQWLQTPALLGAGSLAYLLHQREEEDATRMEERLFGSTAMSFPRIMQPNYVACDSMFGRMFVPRHASTGAVTVGKGLNGSIDSEEEISLATFSDLLSDPTENCHFKKGDIVFKEGDEGKDMFFISSGVVEVSTNGGSPTVLSAGDFVGEAEIVSNAKRSGTVKCKSPVHAIRISKQYFEKYLSASDSKLNAKDSASSKQIFSSFSSLLAENERIKKSFKQNDVIYNEGDKGGDMFFIKSGMVSVTNKDGFKATLKEGNFVGEGALLSNKPRTGTVTCVTPVEGMTISREYFEKYLNSSDKNVRMKMYRENRARDLSRIRMLFGQNPNLRPKKLKKGAVLFKEGDNSKGFYIVIDGEISLSSGRLSVAKYKAGDIVGAQSLLADGPRQGTARCISGECNVVEVGPSAFQEVIASADNLRDALQDLCYQQDFQRALTLYSGNHFPQTTDGYNRLFASIKFNPGQELIFSDVERLIRKIDPNKSQEEILALFRAIDVDGSGSLSVEEFEALCYNI
mmetsp:Transcript_35238/g.85414  ORF Transcript_35238/g.85414 Transcript_35238/m.85414 type:complete len:527 (-) Transcript_35238:260-1840(-)